jgi:hypothetical protein
MPELPLLLPFEFLALLFLYPLAGVLLYLIECRKRQGMSLCRDCHDTQ